MNICISLLLEKKLLLAMMLPSWILLKNSHMYNRGTVQFKDWTIRINAGRRIGKLDLAYDNVDIANEETLQSHITASKEQYETIRT